MPRRLPTAIDARKEEKNGLPSHAANAAADVFIQGWLSDEWIDKMIQNFESKAKPKTPKQKERCAGTDASSPASLRG
jgi:hypothetical protein